MNKSRSDILQYNPRLFLMKGGADMFKKADNSSITIIMGGCSCNCNDACGNSSTQGTKMNGKAKKP